MWGQVWDPPMCSQCPHHVRTGSDAPVPYSEFCEAFRFPAGPSGSPELLVFYELRGPDGGLLQMGRASGCPRLGLHPETLLFGSEGYLQSVMEAGVEVSYIMLFSTSTPCEEPPALCASAISRFLELHPAVRLDLLFAQLHRTGDAQNRAGLRRLAALWPRLTLSPISGGAWAQLQRAFVRDATSSAPPPVPAPSRATTDLLNAARISAITGVGPAFLDPSCRAASFSDPTQAAPTLTLLPPPRLHSYQPLPYPYPRPTEPFPVRPGGNRPINVVRHVCLPPPNPGRSKSSLSSASSSSSSILLRPGRPVEVRKVMKREIPRKS